MKIRPMTTDHYQSVHELEKRVWGEEAASPEMIRARHSTFPEGSVIVTDLNEKIVGYAAGQKLNYISGNTWCDITDDGCIVNTHCEDGHLLYGICLSGEKYGVAQLVLDYVHQKFIKSGECKAFVLGSRLPGFRKWHLKSKGNIDEYLNAKRADGLSIDPELRLYQKEGFWLIKSIDDYFPCEDSGNYGALITKC
ncbi:hypothetical protein [Vibrio sp. WXL103]|uniref:hypothetical protein n=1 Tax=Vibrio sp. WXL103 TaxID=3450710 RepID=UPI003EC59ABB